MESYFDVLFYYEGLFFWVLQEIFFMLQKSNPQGQGPKNKLWVN